MGSRVIRTRLTIAALALALCAFVPRAAEAMEPTVIELPKATHADDLAFEPDGTLWFNGTYGSEHVDSESSEGRAGDFIGRLKPGGAVEQFPLPSTESVGSPVVDPDGGVWMPLSDATYVRRPLGIGHVSATGEFQRYQLSGRRGNTYLMGLSGNDLWVGGTELNRHRVTEGTLIDEVSITPTVAVERTIELSPKCGPSAIAATKTQVWFAELCENESPSNPSWRAAIVHVKPDGALTRYRLPRLSYVTSLDISADSTVWFGSFGTNGTRNELGRIDPHGHLESFLVRHAEPDEIAVGPEERLWFTEEVDRYPHAALNSIGARGDLGRPRCLAADCTLEPFGLAFGPSGDLWFSALASETPYGGGGGGLILAEDRLNQAGFIGQLTEP
jgi:streptogramin lyase